MTPNGKTRTLAVMRWALALLICIAEAGWAIDAQHQGRFYWGHEVVSFHPCRSKNAYWVEGEEKTLQPLRARADRLRKQLGKPYQPIYIEAVGAIDTKAKREGFAEDYDGLFRLREVVRASNVVPKDCLK